MPRVFDPDEPELMDRPQPLSPALEQDLANLRFLNRSFGACQIIRQVLGPHLREGAVLRIADFCTGSGDLPCLIAGLARSTGARVQIDAIDAQPATLEVARQVCGEFAEIRCLEGDVRTWSPESGAAPDWILCSLALHHFRRDDAVHLLHRMRGLALQGVLVADLERAWWATAGIYAASVFFREPMTVHDMRKSARAAFSFHELTELADEAGWPQLRHHRRFFFGRQAIWYENAVAVPAAMEEEDGPLPLPA